MDVLGKHRQMFGGDFSDNKRALDQVTIIRSKGLKNEIAGYITKYIKREIHDQEIKLAREAEQEETQPDQDRTAWPRATTELVNEPEQEKTPQDQDGEQEKTPQDQDGEQEKTPQDQDGGQV